MVAPLIGEKAPLVWEDHFWMLLVNAGRSLAAVRKYIKMNPARKMWKTLNPDRFVRRSGLKHAVLDSSLSWTAIGDLTLLASPFMFPVRLTRRMTVEQHLPEIERMVEKARRGMLPVCGFLSPGEKELERRLREEPFARWIKTVAHGLPQRFDPTVEDSRFLAAGRQLLLSSFPVDVPVFPVNYNNCHLMNARNEALCRKATGTEAVLLNIYFIGDAFPSDAYQYPATKDEWEESIKKEYETLGIPREGNLFIDKHVRELFLPVSLEKKVRVIGPWGRRIGIVDRRGKVN